MAEVLMYLNALISSQHVLDQQLTRRGMPRHIPPHMIRDGDGGHRNEVVGELSERVCDGLQLHSELETCGTILLFATISSTGSKSGRHLIHVLAQLLNTAGE